MFQQIASVDTDIGELQEKRLAHREEANRLYRALAASKQKVRVGMVASGAGSAVERLLVELQFELWIRGAPGVVGFATCGSLVAAEGLYMFAKVVADFFQR